ncbi:MAG: YARHG domain-containing protein [Lachnospiraceae bacterium]|nr:YARHG domain-containing protein [Lachnospiraceae bacterium]
MEQQEVGGIYVQEKDWIENYYEYVFPNSDSQYLTENDFAGLTKEDCRIARNEIYARHGRTFSDEVLQAYFEICSWYNGWIAPEAFDDNLLNDVERYNLEMIRSYEAG